MSKMKMNHANNVLLEQDTNDDVALLEGLYERLADRSQGTEQRNKVLQWFQKVNKSMDFKCECRARHQMQMRNAIKGEKGENGNNKKEKRRKKKE